MLAEQMMIPMNKIPKFCQYCGHPLREEERLRQIQPFPCSNPDLTKPHEIWVSPNPVAVHILLIDLPDNRTGVPFGLRSVREDPGFGKWSLPGGFVGCETARRAAVRELGEEFGVEINEIDALFLTDYYDAVTHCVNLFHASRWPQREPPKLEAKAENKLVRIFTLDDLPKDLAFPYQERMVMEAVAQHYI